jgi:ubiquinone/menaquinone biosynthesis C-methylase UbiE
LGETHYKNLDWSQILFIEHPQLFLPLIEKENANTEGEVGGLCSIFSRFGIKKGARILDLSCGIGRHALSLAKKGYNVTGYDPSRFFVNIANQRIKEENRRNLDAIRFYEGSPGEASKVLLKHNEREFDVIISMWQSFGYKSVQQDKKIFKDLLTIASPNCLLIIDAQNRDWTIRHFQPIVIHEFKESEIHETWNFNFENQMIENISKFYDKDVNGNLRLVLTIPTFTILYSLHELIELLRKAGWTYIKSYGSLQQLQPVCFESQKIITLNRTA